MYKAITLLLTLAVVASCRSGDSISRETTDVPFEDFLGRSVNDKFMNGFFVENNCNPGGPFYVCKSIGLAVWFDSKQLAQTIYLYVTASEGFEPYEGVLPYGLKFYDTMGAVEYKLKLLNEDSGQRFDWEIDLPDQGRSPDHVHYWINYERYAMAIVYNTPFADEDATIYAILIMNTNIN